MLSKYSKQLPTDSTSLKAVKANIDEIVDALVEINGANDLIKSVKETVQEKHGIDGGYIVALAKLKYDNLYAEGKKAEKIREQNEMVDIVEEEL